MAVIEYPGNFYDNHGVAAADIDQVTLGCHWNLSQIWLWKNLFDIQLLPKIVVETDPDSF